MSYYIPLPFVCVRSVPSPELNVKSSFENLSDSRRAFLKTRKLLPCLKKFPFNFQWTFRHFSLNIRPCHLSETDSAFNMDLKHLIFLEIISFNFSYNFPHNLFSLKIYGYFASIASIRQNYYISDFSCWGSVTFKLTPVLVSNTFFFKYIEVSIIGFPTTDLREVKCNFKNYHNLNFKG